MFVHVAVTEEFSLELSNPFSEFSPLTHFPKDGPAAGLGVLRPSVMAW